jgi:hypothetical protein
MMKASYNEFMKIYDWFKLEYFVNEKVGKRFKKE